MTKREVLKWFKLYQGASLPKGDIPALREAWNNYTDMLQKSGDITAKQYDTWSNPF